MPHSFLALGDSYTIGEGVSKRDGWPAQLGQLLGEEVIKLGPPVVIAKTGWTTAELIAGILEAGIDQTYDLVSLLIGVNNQYRNQDLAVYEREFAHLLDRAVEYAGGKPARVLVLSIPDWSVTPFAAAHTGASPADTAIEIDAYNRVNCRQAYQAGCTYVDVTGLTRAHSDDVYAWAEDDLHPAPLMYTQWARKLLPVVRRLIAGR